MGELGRIIESLNIPKQLLEKGEKAINAVFGPSIRELSETLGDNFKLRRFKNQVKILEKAEQYLKEKGIPPKNLDLKVLVPLLEFSSVEENEELQDTWAKLISNLVTVESNAVIKKRAVEVMSNLTNADIGILNLLFERLNHYSLRYRHYMENVKTKINLNELHDTMKDDYYSVWNLKKDWQASNNNMDFEIFNLVDLGLIDYMKTVKVDNKTTSFFGSNTLAMIKNNPAKELDIRFINNKAVQFTRFGVHFINLCLDTPFQR